MSNMMMDGKNKIMALWFPVDIPQVSTSKKIGNKPTNVALPAQQNKNKRAKKRIVL